MKYELGEEMASYWKTSEYLIYFMNKNKTIYYYIALSVHNWFLTDCVTDFFFLF